jgi:hypothetical protein
MKLPSIARIPFVTAALWLAAACALAPASEPTATPAVGATPTAAPQQTPIPTPLATVIPAPTPTQTATLAIASATPGESPATAVPAGTLSADGLVVAGWQGSYCYAGTCADAAAVPAKGQLPALALAAGDGGLEFSVAEPVQFVEWQATYAADTASGAGQLPLAGGGAGFDPDVTPTSPWPAMSNVSFGPPPSGDWALMISVYFDGGDLSYAWHVTVP